MATLKENKDFEITWCESNLVWLNGNPESDENNHRIAYMKDRLNTLRDTPDLDTLEKLG